MFRDRPEIREPRYTNRCKLPALIVAHLNAEAERRAGLLLTLTQARDSYTAELLSAALAARCTPLQTPALRNEESKEAGRAPGSAADRQRVGQTWEGVRGPFSCD